MQKMKFCCKNSEGKLFLEACDDPEIYIHVIGPRRYKGSVFVLHWHGKKIGFSDKDGRPPFKEHDLEHPTEGTVRWVIGNIGMTVESARLGEARLADPFKFNNEKELKEFELILKTVFAEFDGSLSAIKGGPSKTGEVVFSEDLRKRIGDGDLIK